LHVSGAALKTLRLLGGGDTGSQIAGPLPKLGWANADFEASVREGAVTTRQAISARAEADFTLYLRHIFRAGT